MVHLQQKTRFFICMLLSLLSSPPVFGADAPLDLAGLSHLIAEHKPLAAKKAGIPEERFEHNVVLTPGAEPTVFLIPGFIRYGCNRCHDPKDLVQKAVTRIGKITDDLAATNGTRPPLRQYIIQPYADALLKPHQFAHATFDTIRLFPRTLIIDTKVYGNATQRHETLHLLQKFVGPANELEAYSLNIRSDPRFLLLHFPYFSNVTRAFFVQDYYRILQRYFSWTIDEKTAVPREVQFFLQPFDEKAMARLARAVVAMEPLLQEVSRLNRNFPLPGAYLSEQTGIPSLLLDIAAARLLSPLPSSMDDGIKEKALTLLAEQMERTDNTRLGYRIDRKQEALLIIRHQLQPLEPQQELALYFNYLRNRFVKEDGNIDLRILDREDFHSYVYRKLGDIRRLQQFPAMTPIERRAGERVIEGIKKEFPSQMKQ
ncbi:MAG: hypothetical protein VYC17_00660 [Nitrospinota bacterium]|nr:hypothetical protein [Nitrospinota bacterium]